MRSVGDDHKNKKGNNKQESIQPFLFIFGAACQLLFNTFTNGLKGE